MTQHQADLRPFITWNAEVKRHRGSCTRENAIRQLCGSVVNAENYSNPKLVPDTG